MPEEFDLDQWMERLMASGGVKSRSSRGWRACHCRLVHFAWYRWIGDRLACLRARIGYVPAPVPISSYHEELGLRTCLWEGDVSYVSTWKFIPGTKVELLCHRLSNRVVGIKIWE